MCTCHTLVAFPPFGAPFQAGDFSLLSVYQLWNIQCAPALEYAEEQEVMIIVTQTVTGMPTECLF